MWFSWNEHARTIYTHIHLYKNNDILTVKAWKKTFTLTFVIWTQIKIWSNTTFYVQLYGLYCGLVMTYIATQIWVNTGSGNGLLPDGSKPLPEPMMTSPQWCPMAFKWEQFPWCFRNQFTAWIIKLLPHFPGPVSSLSKDIESSVGIPGGTYLTYVLLEFDLPLRSDAACMCQWVGRSLSSRNGLTLEH